MQKTKVVTDTALLLVKRKETKLTHEGVGIAINISPSSYSMIEAGHRRPSVEVAMKLGRLLGFNWWELYIEVPDSATDINTSE